MKASDIFMAKEPIEFAHGGEDCVAVYARPGYVYGRCGCDREAFWPMEHIDDHPPLAAFIGEAKAYFAPKKSCGDLTMEDLIDLTHEFDRNVTPGGLRGWAASRNIQLPEDK